MVKEFRNRKILLDYICAIDLFFGVFFLSFAAFIKHNLELDL